MDKELTKEHENILRILVREHSEGTYHPNSYWPKIGIKHACRTCEIAMLLKEIDKLREENLRLRVNP